MRSYAAVADMRLAVHLLSRKRNQGLAGRLEREADRLERIAAFVQKKTEGGKPS